MDLKGKVVVITGGGRGLGRATAEACAARGAHIAVLDLNEAELAETCASCSKHGVQARGYRANVTDESDISATLDAVVADFGRLDVMVNNAGITKDGLLIKVKDGEVSGKMSLDQWNAVINVNLTGVFLGGREAAERMIKLGNGGVIVNISSISRAGNYGQTNYAASKAGVVAMTVVWAKELARYGIRAGAIAPGFIKTEILAAMKPEMLEKVTAPVPLKRLGEPDEIARSVVFIAENDFFSGRVIEVDGGLRM